MYIIQTSRSKWQPYNISVPLDLKVTKDTRLILNIIYVWKLNQTVLECIYIYFWMYIYIFLNTKMYKLKNLLVWTKFYWSWAREPVLIVMTVIVGVRCECEDTINSLWVTDKIITLSVCPYFMSCKFISCFTWFPTARMYSCY
jgi:hypothetical protein